MADTTVRRLKDRLARLQGEVARLQAQIEAYRRVIADLEQEDDPNLAATPAKVLVNQMWRILEDAGCPMHYREIYQKLLDLSVNIPGQDPLKNVGAHLSADQRFEKLGKGVWTLKSWGSSAVQAAEGEPEEHDLRRRDDLEPSSTGSDAPPTSAVISSLGPRPVRAVDQATAAMTQANRRLTEPSDAIHRVALAGVAHRDEIAQRFKDIGAAQLQTNAQRLTHVASLATTQNEAALRAARAIEVARQATSAQRVADRAQTADRLARLASGNDARHE